MNSSAPQTLSLAEFGISSERGFLPSDPCETVADSPILNQLGHELPKLLSARNVRRFVDEQPSLLPSIPATWREDEYRAAMRILSFAGHAYVWETPGQPAAKLPSQLARPWYEIAQKLGVSPNTVKTQVASLYQKLEVQRRTQAVQKARELALIP